MLGRIVPAAQKALEKNRRLAEFVGALVFSWTAGSSREETIAKVETKKLQNAISLFLLVFRLKSDMLQFIGNSENVKVAEQNYNEGVGTIAYTPDWLEKLYLDVKKGTSKTLIWFGADQKRTYSLMGISRTTGLGYNPDKGNLIDAIDVVSLESYVVKRQNFIINNI